MLSFIVRAEVEGGGFKEVNLSYRPLPRWLLLQRNILAATEGWRNQLMLLLGCTGDFKGVLAEWSVALCMLGIIW